MVMKPEDHKLSMDISPRGKIDSEKLRQLLVLRLSDTTKAVLRRSLRSNNLGVFCERCRRWQDVKGDAPAEWTCRRCEALYRIEFAVYEEITREEID